MKINELKAGTVLTYVSMGVRYLVLLSFTPIMLRLLGQSEYGLYNLVASVVAYLSLLNFGFGGAYMRYFSKYKAEGNRVKIAKLNGMFLIIFALISVIAFTVGMVLVQYTDGIFGTELTVGELKKAKILMSLMVINIALSFPNIVFNSHITANEKFVFQKLLQLIQSVVNPFVILPVLIMGYGSVGMVVATTLLNITIEIINIVFCRKRLGMKFIFRDLDFNVVKEVLVFSSFIFVNIIADQINWNVDKYLLGRYHGTITVAIYGLAAQLNTSYLSLSIAISNVFIPRVHNMVAAENNNQKLTELFTKIGRVQFILLSLIASGLVFLGRPFINIWAGAEYDSTYIIALILIIPVTIPLIQNIGIEIQRAKNMHKFMSWVYFAIAVANITLTLFLAKAYKGIGAAIGTAISLIIGNGIVMNWFYQTKVGLDIKYFWRQIARLLIPLLVPVVYGIFINKYINLYSLTNFLLCGVVYVVIFCVSMWYLGLNDYEKDLFRRPFKKIVNRWNTR